MRVLAVDPGEKRIGLAISDPTGSLARPLAVIKHISKKENARRIAAIAKEHDCGLIIVGQALTGQGGATLSGRRANNLAGSIQLETSISVQLWEESGSTKAARAAAIRMGVAKKKRQGHLDDAAAAVILQEYLDSQRPSQNNPLGP